nr:hypothetical protein Iba_chr12bCG3400 [Ipomoea batatas]
MLQSCLTESGLKLLRGLFLDIELDPFFPLGLGSHPLLMESKLTLFISIPSTFPASTECRLLPFKSSLFTDSFAFPSIFLTSPFFFTFFGSDRLLTVKKSLEIKSFGSPTHGRRFATGFSPRSTGTGDPASSRVTWMNCPSWTESLSINSASSSETETYLEESRAVFTHDFSVFVVDILEKFEQDAGKGSENSEDGAEERDGGAEYEEEAKT